MDVARTLVAKTGDRVEKPYWGTSYNYAPMWRGHFCLRTCAHPPSVGTIADAAGKSAYATSERNCNWSPNFFDPVPGFCHSVLGFYPLAHVELQLPATPVARHAPQLQHARLGHDCLERDRHYLGGALTRRQIDLHGR